MNYKLRLYTITQDKVPSLHSTYEFNAHARPAFKKLINEGKSCFLTSVDHAGVEEFLEISSATEETNSNLRALFFMKFLLGNWAEKEQLDWLKVRILHRAEKQINC